ncbi:right-handed parallel beta-helix repeat-containing protein [Verrucomicrobiota bacterium]
MIKCVLVLVIGMGLFLADVRADYYAAQNGQTPTGPYDTWAKAASNIQNAVNAAAANDTVWVGAGRYTVPTNAVAYASITNVVYMNKPLALRSSNGVPSEVIIDGQNTNRGIHLAYSVTTTNRFVLSGVTISSAYTNGILFTANVGILWTGVVDNCVVTGTLGYAIDGKAAKNIAVIVSNSVVRNSTGIGVNLYGSSGRLTMTDCTVENNLAVGFSFHLGTHTFTRCIVRGNVGGFSIGSGLNQLYSCLINNNVAANGGAIYGWNNGTDVRVYNSTIVSNKATGSGGGIRTSGSSASFKFFNTILYSNYLNAAHNNYFLTGNTNSSFTNTCTFPSLAGSGNINSKPQFVDFAGQNFRLVINSPCVNTGTNQNWMITGFDLDGKIRLRYGTVDMGAYEKIYEGTIYGIR